MIHLVDEGAPFTLHGRDRQHVTSVLAGDLGWTATGCVVWNVVGHIPLPSGSTLMIRPKKASAACLLAWAAYVDPALGELRHVRLLDDVVDDGDVGAALARTFCAELLRTAAARGLLRRYRRVRVRSTVVRGAIEFAQLARMGGDLSRVPCIAWERLPKTPLNQMLAAALDVVARDPILRAASGSELLALGAIFSSVARRLDPAMLEGKRPLERDELPFGPSAALARMILRGSGSSSGEANRGFGFLVRLDRLFERAVVQALDDAGLGGITKAPAKYVRGDLHRADESAGGTFELDYFVPGSSAGGVVVDAKYKKCVSAENLQQMVAYCHLTGASRAILVFPKGQVGDRRPYVFRRPDGAVVRVDIEELETSGRTVAEWRQNGRALGDRVRAHDGPRTSQVAVPVEPAQPRIE